MAIRQLIFLIVFLVCWSLQGQRIAIMGAMDEEIEFLKQDLKRIKKVQKNGVTFYTGKLKGRKVVLLKAGIGKVNASYSAAILMANFEISSLIFTGVAGGLHPDIKPGDIVISTKLIQYDFGKLQQGVFETWPTRNLAQNNAKSPLFLEVDSVLLKKSKNVSNSLTLKPFNNRIPKFFVGPIATGDTFVSDPKKAKELYTRFNALAAEMEGAAVAQICTMLQVPFIIIRSCSDNANTDAHIDYLKFVQIAATNSAQMVLGLLENEN